MVLASSVILFCCWASPSLLTLKKQLRSLGQLCECSANSWKEELKAGMELGDLQVGKTDASWWHGGLEWARAQARGAHGCHPARGNRVWMSGRWGKG